MKPKSIENRQKQQPNRVYAYVYLLCDYRIGYRTHLFVCIYMYSYAISIRALTELGTIKWQSSPFLLNYLLTKDKTAKVVVKHYFKYLSKPNYRYKTVSTVYVCCVLCNFLSK